MKRRFLMIFSAAALILSGCSRASRLSENDTAGLPEYVSDMNLSEISEIRSELPLTVKKLKSEKFENIFFDNDFSVKIPEEDSLYILKFTRKNPLSPADLFDKFDKIFDEEFSGIYTLSDKEKLYRFISADIKPTGADYPDNYPKYFDYREQINSGEITVSQLFTDRLEGYLAVNPSGAVHALNCGKAAGLDGRSSPVGMYFPGNYHETIAVYTDINSENSHALLDGEITVKAAARTASEIIDFAGYGGGSGLSAAVSQVKAIDLGNGINGYSLTVAPSYKGVMFDVYSMESDGGFSSYKALENHNYRLMPANAFMLESDKLDIIVGYDSAYDVTEVSACSSVISPADAADILSQFFSGRMKLNLQCAELMYAMYYTDENSENAAAEIIWKFTGNGVNDSLNYIVYVNAADGSCDYYTY